MRSTTFPSQQVFSSTPQSARRCDRVWIEIEERYWISTDSLSFDRYASVKHSGKARFSSDNTVQMPGQTWPNGLVLRGAGKHKMPVAQISRQCAIDRNKQSYLKWEMELAKVTSDEPFCWEKLRWILARFSKDFPRFPMRFTLRSNAK